MDGDIVHRVKEHLNLKHFATNDGWLKDCVEYYLSEHPNVGERHPPDETEILEFVISQWQLSDLREISNEKPCLPKNLASQKRTTLRGCFVLQMDKVYDVSESKYGQIEKIRRLTSDNARVNEAEDAGGEWKPKKRRTLRLGLTDGSQEVVAIEYKPIRSIGDSLLPGYKLLIKGPVDCRRGVIMLEEKHIEGIGGEVDNLLIPNAPENVFARALNLPENPDPYGDNGKPKEEEEVVVVVESTQEDRASRVDNLTAGGSDDTRKEKEPAGAPAPLVSRSESDLIFDEIADVIFDEDDAIDGTLELGIQDGIDARENRDSREEKIGSIDISKEETRVSRWSLETTLVRSNVENTLAKRPDDESSTRKKRSAAVLSPDENTSSGKIRCPRTSVGQNAPDEKNNRKITEYLTKNRESVVPWSAAEPHGGVCLLANLGSTDSVSCKTVRARVTKIDNLSKNGQSWRLMATISDDTASIDVEFASEILESMLGFGVTEFSRKRKLKKTDPNMDAYLRQGFRSAEKKLSELDDFLQIKLAPGEKPMVVGIKGGNDG